MDKQVDECRQQYQDKQEQYDTDLAKHLEQLKEEIVEEREARAKLRPPSQTTSVGSSVVIYPPETSSLSDLGDSPTHASGEGSPTLAFDSPTHALGEGESGEASEGDNTGDQQERQETKASEVADS